MITTLLAELLKRYAYIDGTAAEARDFSTIDTSVLLGNIGANYLTTNKIK